MSISKFVQLKNGYKMPTVGLGTWLIDSNNVKKAINVAFDSNYKCIDTSPMYKNENAIGEACSKWIKSGRLSRDDMYLTSKLPPIGLRAKHVRQFLKKSLKDLKVDYLDMYLVHLPVGIKYTSEDAFITFDSSNNIAYDFSTNLIEVWKAMEEQVDAGLVKSIGLSNFNINQIQRILEKARIKPVNLQMEFHVYFQQNELIQFCKKNDIVVTGYCTLGSSDGVSQKILNGGSALEDVVVNNIASKHGRTVGQILLRHSIQKGLTIIPKSVDPRRIKKNIDIFDFELDNLDMDLLENLNKQPFGRMFDLSIYKGATKHPEFPFH